MQNINIMSFRKRLKKRGYKEIKIKRSCPKMKIDGDYLYTVSAIEPLTKMCVKADYTVLGMYYSFKYPDYSGFPFDWDTAKQETEDDNQLVFDDFAC